MFKALRSSLAVVLSTLLLSVMVFAGNGPRVRHPAIAGYFLFQQDIPAKTVVMKGQASTPANPSAGWYKLFVDNTGALKLLDSAGGVTTFGAGGGGFELQTETSFTNNNTPAIFLKAPTPNSTRFLRFNDNSDANMFSVYSDGGAEAAGGFFAGNGIYASNTTSLTLRTTGNFNVGVFREYGSLSFEGANPSTSGVPKAWLDFTGTQNNSGITASTEYNAFWYNPPRTYTWAAGPITNQRFWYMRAPTAAFASASTITNAATLAISGAPVAGTNATITNPYALWVGSGTSQFDGNVSLGSSNVLLLGGATSPGTATRLQLGTPTTTNNSVNVYIEPTATNVTPLAIQGNASQTADLFQVFNSSGTKVFYVNAKGVAHGSPSGIGINATAFGHLALDASGGGVNATVFGYSAGYNLNSSGTEDTLLGSNAGYGLTTGAHNVVVGAAALQNDQTISSSVIIGSGALNQSNGGYTGTGPVLAIGRSAGSDLTNQNNIAVFGSATSPLNDWYFGESYSTASPSDITFQPSVGSGTNIAGSSFYIKGGAGTGNATPGKIYLQYASAGSSGATVQSYTTAVTIDSSATDVAGLLQIDRIAGTTSAPSISAGAAAGTTPTVSVTGTDLAGEIVVTTGTGSVGGGTLATITLNTAFANDCYPVIQAADADSRGVAVSITHSSTGFTIVAGAAGWNTSTEYRWTYIVAGR